MYSIVFNFTTLRTLKIEKMRRKTAKTTTVKTAHFLVRNFITKQIKMVEFPFSTTLLLIKNKLLLYSDPYMQI